MSHSRNDSQTSQPRESVDAKKRAFAEVDPAGLKRIQYNGPSSWKRVKTFISADPQRLTVIALAAGFLLGKLLRE